MATAAEYQSRIESLHWDGLRALWSDIGQRDTPDWEPGKAFEYLVLRAFQLDGADVKWPYSVKLFEEEIEQIDGVIHCEGLSCLAESKDFAKEAVDNGPVAKLRSQLLRRPTGTVGSIFSRTGFTGPARSLSYLALPQTVLLWNGQEIQYALERERICRSLTLKYRACVADGLTDYNTMEGIIP
ncbi:MAG: hypothetical protein HC860_14055 [Alkalinema sp. RU_4_3]|nr:hypothetical protein [Alkalinema sp. RU_4_3]